MINLPKQHLNIHIQNIISDARPHIKFGFICILFCYFINRLKRFNILQDKKYYKTYSQPKRSIYNKINLIVNKHSKYITITLKLFIKPEIDIYKNKNSIIKININNSPKEINNIITLLKLNPEYTEQLIKIYKHKEQFSEEVISRLKQKFKSILS